MRSSNRKLSRLASIAVIGSVLAALGGAAAAVSAGKVFGNIPANQVDAATKVTRAVMERHAEAMKSRDVEAIAADYSEDVVVVATLFGKPIVGKAEMKKAIGQFLAMKVDPLTMGNLEKVREDFRGEYGYWTFQDKATGKIATETYVVRKGKIVFETATFPLELRADQ
ncbi:MAG: hypothetical protein QM605_02200 [Sphingobium sp.]